MVRHDYFQTDTQVVLTLYVKGVPQEEVDVQLDEFQLPENGTRTALHLTLYAPVRDPTLRVSPSKVELALVKQQAAPTAAAAAAAPAAAAPQVPRPRSKWDALHVEDEPPAGGDAELNAFFQKLYADADDDTRRAMVKSFQESNGTALSTNWAEVSQKTTETRAPAGMVPKKYDT